MQTYLKFNQAPSLADQTSWRVVCLCWPL